MKIGRYELVGTLGSGGMSSVSLARSEGGELVVLKRQHSPAEDAALKDEARVGIRLHHPNIVDHLDLFEHEGRPVLVVEYVSGATLADLKACGPLPPGLICRIGQQIAEALHYIHTATEEDGQPLCMLHRDVTPSNIIVGHDGNARLIDFGIARSIMSRSEVTKDGVLKGTLRYLAPELLSDDVGAPASYSVATDLWGLGMSLFEAALGRLAVEGDDPVVFAKIVSGRAMTLLPGEDLDPILRQAVAQLLTLEPSCRPPTADHAALVFGQYVPTFTNLDETAKAYVESAVGPPAEDFDESTTLYQAHQLVNRAAATYGGPLGDWKLADDVARSRRVVELPPSGEGSGDDADAGSDAGFFEMAPTLPVEAYRPVGAPASEPSDTDPTSGPSVPAPVELPSLPDEQTETIDMAELRRARAREVADQFLEDAKDDPWLAPLTQPEGPESEP